MSIVSMGFYLSTIAGVPLGLLLSRAWGWRGVMASLAGAMLIIAVVSYRLLPHPLIPASSVPRTPTSFPPKARTSHWLGGQLPILYASAMAFFAVGIVYTYMPDMLTRHRASADALPAILLGYGLFNLAGNYFFWMGHGDHSGGCVFYGRRVSRLPLRPTLAWRIFVPEIMPPEEWDSDD